MSKFGVKEVLDVTFYDTVTKKPVAFFDTLKLSTIENTSEETSARGGRSNPKLLTWSFNREANMKIQDALLSPKSFAMLSGNTVAKGVTAVYMRQDTEYALTEGKMQSKGDLFPLTASGAGSVTLAFTPKETAANILVYDASDDGGTPLAAGTLSGLVLTNASWANKKLVVYYTYDTDASAETYVITSDKFPSTFKIVGDTVVRNAETGKDEAFQVIIDKAQLKSNFTLQFQADGDPSVFDMDVEILKAGDSSKMITMIKY